NAMSVIVIIRWILIWVLCKAALSAFAQSVSDSSKVQVKTPQKIHLEKNEKQKYSWMNDADIEFPVGENSDYDDSMINHIIHVFKNKPREGTIDDIIIADHQLAAYLSNKSSSDSHLPDSVLFHMLMI